MYGANRVCIVIGAFGVYRVIGHVCYSRTATIVFSSSLVCLCDYSLFVLVRLDVSLFVCLFVCPGLFLDTVNSTVPISHTHLSSMFRDGSLLNLELISQC